MFHLAKVTYTEWGFFLCFFHPFWNDLIFLQFGLMGVLPSPLALQATVKCL